MSQTTQLIYPTVDLFLYDLHSGLGQSPEQINHNRRRFWRRIYNNSLSEQELADLQAEEGTFSRYVELLGTKRIEQFQDPLDGYYYPVKLGDTYALQIDCSGKKNDPDWEQLSQPEQLRQIKKIILDLTHQLPSEMGQTWLVWGQLATPGQDPEATAKDCYKAIQIVPKPNWKRDCKGQGRFQKATFFEIERPDITPDGLNRNYHVIICLFLHDQTKDEFEKTISKLHPHFIRLFHYRNKILWIYEQSRQLKYTLKDSSSAVQTIVDSLSHRITDSYLNLNQLQQDLADALSISHYYETNLGYLLEHHSTIKVNTRNYQNRVQAIAQQDPNSDLAFLERFGEFATEKCLTQLNTDYQTLSAGLKPLENFIKTIQGIIDIEKTKNERTLNKTVAIASVGISTASLAASTFTNQAEGIVKTIFPVPPKQPTPPLNLWASFGLSFSLSLVIGLFSAWITWLVLHKSKLFHKKRRKKERQRKSRNFLTNFLTNLKGRKEP